MTEKDYKTAPFVLEPYKEFIVQHLSQYQDASAARCMTG